MKAAGEAVAAVLSQYQEALNASDVAAVLELYADDGVFLAPGAPSAVGKAAIRSSYEAIFRAIRLAVTFDVAEAVELAPDWAFARTNSAGTVTVLAAGTQAPEGNQELFLFRRDAAGGWKIARYGFSSTRTPQP